MIRATTIQLLRLFSPILFLAFALAGCASIDRTIVPTAIVTLPSGTPPQSLNPTPLYTLAPGQARETIEPLLREPMNCAVPCFWGIVPGKSQMSEARNRFGHLGFTPFEGKDPNSGKDFYTIEYKADTGYGVSVTLYGSNDLVQNIVVTPDIPEPKEGSPRAWIAYSPETLIARFGSPSRVEFAVGLGPNIGINMITYYGASDLIVLYSGYNMTPERFCPLTVPFDHVELWMGQNAPDTPSFATVSLEKATSLTIDEFAQLMRESPEQACFTLKTEVFR